MRRKLRRLLFIIAPPFLIFLLLTIILNSFFSPARLQALLIEPAERDLGRVITLGSADFSLLGGITISDLAVKELNSEQNFITVKTLRLSYQLLPLLRRELVIKKVLVDEPQIRISKNSGGRYNFADLARKPEEELLATATTKVPAPLPLSLIFDRVNIKNAGFTFTDATEVLPAVQGKADLSVAITPGKTLTDLKFIGDLNFVATSEYRGNKPVLQATCKINNNIVTYDGNLTVGFAKVKVNGWVANYLSAPATELNISSTIIDFEEMASLRQFINDNSPGQAPRKAAKEGGYNGPNLTAHGKVNILEIASGRLKMRDLALVYRIADHVLTLDKVSALIFGGTISGDIAADISTEQPFFMGKLKGEEINTAEVMLFLGKPAEILGGKLAVDLTFQGGGKEWPVIRKNLKGEGRLTLLSGGILHAPLSTALAGLLGIKELSDLRFQNFAGDFTILNEQVSLDSSLQSLKLNIQSTGAIGLDGALHLPLTLQLTPEYSEILGNNPTFSRYLVSAEPGLTSLHLLAKGSLEKPQLTLDGTGGSKQIITKTPPAPKRSESRDPVKEMSELLLKEQRE